MTSSSQLVPTLEVLGRRARRSMIARARIASAGLNQWLEGQFARPPGHPGALLAEPLIEMSRVWEPAGMPLSDLAPGLLSAELVGALDRAEVSRLPADRPPYSHQVAAWRATLAEGKSAIVTSGTGAGKTECFLIPVLQDCLANPRVGGGIRAILVYPLNALIESQRARLSAWVQGLGGRVRFALLNAETAETEREAAVPSDRFELRSRQMIRSHPPEILVTNITMLEYLLLRGADRPILEKSQGALRWMVLDEAHSYAGSQAAEMALLLRRVRAGFGVGSADVRLIATSATIGGEARTEERLAAFAGALAGQPPEQVAVIEGRERAPGLPEPGRDGPLDQEALARLESGALGAHLAAHPRVQALRTRLAGGGQPLSSVARVLTGNPERQAEAVALLDLCGRAEWQGRPLLPWRAHIFHRAQGGLWACPDPACPHRAPELRAPGAGWDFGATYLTARSTCECGAPVYEVASCSDCGRPHLQGVLIQGAQPRLDPPDAGEGDDFILDAEPEEEDQDGLATAVGTGLLVSPSRGDGMPGWLAADGRWFDNAPPAETRSFALRLIEDPDTRACCHGAGRSAVMGLRFGPNFLIGATLPGLVEDIAPPDRRPGLPCGGRRAISFSDSRQGVARLAAKLQQGAERELTRAFVYHAVQERSGGGADPAEILALQRKIAALEGAGLGDLAADDRRRLADLTEDVAPPVAWRALVQGLAGHTDLRSFAGTIWRGRKIGREMAEAPEKLAEMFLYRELFRRPRVQNNPETLGLVQLAFPALVARAQLQGPPRALREAGFSGEDWAGLAQTAVDLVFRQQLAVRMEHWMVRLVLPRHGQLHGIVPAGRPAADRADAARLWPTPVPRSGRLSRLARLIYDLTGGTPDSRIDQDRTGEVLSVLWELITATAVVSSGRDGFQLDFGRATVARLDRVWLCPVTRRPYPYSLAGRSPNDPALMMAAVDMPRLPTANRAGLLPEDAAAVAQWCENDERVADLRKRGMWTDLHDRIAVFPPYLRAQEHSAQIHPQVLRRYEQEFAAGRINLLNCSTTMEMGVDLADVRLVVNTNVPPSLANYRQRAGRAGRRGEPWGLTVTYCRDLPLDRRCFDDPAAYLARPIVAPRVWFDSAALVRRHVNAALLAAWLGERSDTRITGSIGAFLGAGNSADAPVADGALADQFLADLDAGWAAGQAEALADLVRGTALSGQDASAMAARCRDDLDHLVRVWRTEHRTLLDGAAAAADPATRDAQSLRAWRLAGEFLLGELARRGFSPAYGFPTDVVTFENLDLRRDDHDARPRFSHEKQGTASRPLDQALREYAPGAEVVIDGLVHRSEGILPAWEAGADASGLEDLRTLWSCPACEAFDWAAASPEACPHCGHALDFRQALRPVGFLAAAPAHVGYENLAHVATDPTRLSAHGGEWVALPAGAGRMRSDPAGRVAVSSSGPARAGFAICLDCGRAHPMERGGPGLPTVLPDAMRQHAPLFLRRGRLPTRDGLCPGADSPRRIQRDVHLAQVKRTDVWQWQLPAGPGEAAARALAAALREALSERLGVEPREIGPAAGTSSSPAGERVVSVFLHDLAAGGAGLSARMAEVDLLGAVVARAAVLLDCPEGCRRGCPACILRPDMNIRGLQLDRPGALALAQALRDRIDLPAPLRIFGPGTRLAGQSAASLIALRLRQGQLRGLDLWLHGDPKDWHLSDWPIRDLLARLADAGIRPRIALDPSALTAAGLHLDRKLGLHALSEAADLHLAAALPASGEGLIVAHLHGSETEALAVLAPTEALPSAVWGLGADAPVLVGAASAPPVGSRLSTRQLVALGTGNARLLWPKAVLDGPVAGFGQRFWGWLAREAPLAVAAMRGVGVRQLSYTDRYLLQASSLRSLAEVLRAAPGARAAQVEVDLAADDRPPSDPRFVHHNFISDSLRSDVLRALVPGATVQIRAKAAMPHYRAMTALLTDGRRIEIMLDQGFGSWRVASTLRHDFHAPAAAQARALAGMTWNLAADALPVPVAVISE